MCGGLFWTYRRHGLRIGREDSYMKKGDTIEGKVIRHDYPGRGILLAENREVAVKGVLPGQTVRCRVKKANSSKCEAMLLDVLERSDREIASDCPHDSDCGGCQMRTFSYQDQLDLKADQIRRLLEDTLVDPSEGWFEGIHPSPDETGYRNKMEFTFGDPFKGGPLVLGMHKKGSFYDIVDTSDCKIVDPDIRIIRTAVLDLAVRTSLPYYHRLTHAGFFRHLLVRKARSSGQILVDLVTTTQYGQTTPELDKELVQTLTSLRLDGEITGILHTYNDSLADIVQSDRTELLYGNDVIEEKLLGLEFQITPFSFFQTNSRGAEVLYDTVREYIGDTKDKVIFDLYSGTGTIAQILAPVAKHVTGVEIVAEAVEAARRNARKNQLSNCDFICGDVLKTIDSLEEKPDLIILDPPRDGIHPRALPKILKFQVERIVYISCKATSLKRDLVTMQQAGYRVKRLSLTDLFPGTSHVETVVLLSNRNSSEKNHIKVNVDMEEYRRIKAAE